LSRIGNITNRGEEMRSVTKLSLHNMVFYTYHGVYAAEQELGQRLEVDVEVTGEFGVAATNDSIEAAINYVAVYDLVKEVVTQQNYQLIERIGKVIAEQIMNQFQVPKVTVRVRKPQPPLGGIVDYSQFEITLEA
jgi:dihydroneopterin aldolase